MFIKKVEQLQSKLIENNLDAFVIIPGSNFRFLTGGDFHTIANCLARALLVTRLDIVAHPQLGVSIVPCEIAPVLTSALGVQTFVHPHHTACSKRLHLAVCIVILCRGVARTERVTFFEVVCKKGEDVPVICVRIKPTDPDGIELL